MPLTRTQKDEQIQELSEALGNSQGLYLADLSGMSVEVVTRFRQACRENQVQVQVIKNTLIARATQGTEFEPIGPYLEGPTAVLVAGGEDAIAPARVLDKFIKENKLPKIKAACLEGVVYDEAGVKNLSSLPTRDELIAMLARALNAPLTNLAGVLNATARNLAHVLQEVAKKKGE
ncbi:MAG: 50S ribosomal protein L10 [Candidatus Eisenbacteria bacterium]